MDGEESPGAGPEAAAIFTLALLFCLSGFSVFLPPIGTDFVMFNSLSVMRNVNILRTMLLLL